MEDLKELRKAIDAVDAELVASLQKRLEITAKIAEYKAETGAELFCPEREDEKLEVLRKILGDYPYAEYVVSLFRDIMDNSKLQQSRTIFGTKDIFLIGMPGCGKSVIGEELADKTYRDFYDMDSLYRETYGISPADMIKKYGESAFRYKETELLRNLSGSEDARNFKDKGRIISCGGGIVVRDENKELLKKNSIVIYIRRDLKNLSSKGRPLSASIGVEKLYEQRASKYEGWSDITIVNDEDIDSCINKILKELKSIK